MGLFLVWFFFEHRAVIRCVPSSPALHEEIQAGLLCVTSGPYIPTAAISITVQCLAHCQLLLGSQPAPRSLVPFFSFLSLGENSSQLSEGEQAGVTEVES